jgi:aspartate aminotransferase
MAVDAKAKRLRAEGRDVLGFGAGEPDFDTPDHIKRAAIAAIERGETKYGEARGSLALREAICEKFRRDNALTYAPDEVIVGIGGKHVLYELFQATLDEGDEVIVPAPYWVSYPDQIELAGGRPVIVSAGADADYKITPEQLRAAITPATRALVLNSPSNPTGMVMSREELAALVEVALEAGLMIVSDEIYEHLLYDGAVHHSVAALSEAARAATITVNGFSKTYSMTGWRLGYAAGPRDVIGAMARIQSHATSNPTTFAQSGAVVALRDGYDFLPAFLAAFDERRRILCDSLNAIDGVRCPVPTGAFYVFPDMSGLLGRLTPDGVEINSTLELAEWLLDAAGVAVVPGEGFGAPGSVRLSYAVATSTVREGARRLAEAIATLRT